MSSGEKPGLAYALDRLKRLVAPPVRFTPPPSGVRFDRDVEVRVRDGTVLRVNVFRPPGEGPFPVILSAHPYSKDNFARRTPWGGYLPTFTYRVMRQSAPFTISAWTSWEAPDPAFWTSHGYAVVNADLRGFFRSEGVGDLFSDQEAEDYHDLVEWAGVQPWSNGRVGTNGVSYLALSQWKMAALRPAHLAAICPWEGFTDVYRDLAYPGGIREDGFVRVWSRGVSTQKRCRTDFRGEQLKRPLDDEWWASTRADLGRIEVPALICASFSDHNLHSRGSFRAFREIGSAEKWLYTHRGGKWATYYSPEALSWQLRFFDRFLKGSGLFEEPPVRLEVREDGDSVFEVRGESQWPPASVSGHRLALEGDKVVFSAPEGRATFSWRFPSQVELTGPYKLFVEVSVEGAEDVCLFAGVRKLRGGRHVHFEGSYGFGYDMVSHGWLRASLRDGFTARRPLASGEVVALEMELLPASTVFRAGEELRLDLQGQWFFPFHPLLGSFPAYYELSPPAQVTVHCGRAWLEVPKVS